MQEQEQLAQLYRMRKIATGLLVLMAVVFVVSRLLQNSYGYLSFVTAFAEAAMVGALADWFAVTALFRNPLGLPIPHTAIIPNNKDRIGESVANFLEHNFMTHEVLKEELEHIDFTGAAAAWLAVPGNRRAVARQVVSGVPVMVRMMEDEDVSLFLQNTMNAGLRNVKLGPLLGEVLSALVVDGRHQALFDHLVRMAAKALEEHRPYIRQKIHEESPRWMPRIVDEKLFERMVEGAQHVLDEMMQEDSEWRSRFQLALEDLIVKLRTAPEVEEKIATVIRQGLSHPMFRNYAVQVWNDVKGRVLADVESEESRAVIQLDRMLNVFALALKEDAAVQAKLNHWIRGFAAESIANRRHAIADLVTRVIKKWDAETVSRKFELYVGKDLQYIRINGTLVGGIVGVGLHIVSRFL